MYYEYDYVQEAFVDLGNKLLTLEPTVSPRGDLTREIINLNFTVKSPTSYTTSRTKKTYAFAELLWYLTGNNTLEQIGAYAPLWHQIADSQGKLNSNYGNYLFKQGQFNKIVQLLTSDWASRKAVIQIFQPSTIDSKDTTCSVAIQYFIRPELESHWSEVMEGKPEYSYKLHQIFTIRSNDAVRGFPYDFMMFAVFQQMMCNTLNSIYQNNFQNSGLPLEIGDFHYNAGSFHVYERDIDDLTQAVTEDTAPNIPLFDMIAQNEISKAIEMEKELRTKKKFANTDQFVFASEFWQSAMKVLTNKFCK